MLRRAAPAAAAIVRGALSTLATAADIVRGQQLYSTWCAGCHGADPRASQPQLAENNPAVHESLDFSASPVVAGACSAGTVPVYRAYNTGSSRGIESNHRITTNRTAIGQS